MQFDRIVSVVSPPRHPAIIRDISIIVDDTLLATKVRDTIRSAAPATLVRVREFDRYQGKGVPDGRVSLSYRLTFQAADRTLTDAEVQRAMDEILQSLGRAATQVVAFLVNAAKGTPIASFIGAPELLSALTDITSFSTGRVTTYWLLLIFYILVVMIVVWLCGRLQVWLERSYAAA